MDVSIIAGAYACACGENGSRTLFGKPTLCVQEVIRGIRFISHKLNAFNGIIKKNTTMAY